MVRAQDIISYARHIRDERATATEARLTATETEVELDKRDRSEDLISRLSGLLALRYEDLTAGYMSDDDADTHRYSLDTGIEALVHMPSASAPVAILYGQVVHVGESARTFEVGRQIGGTWFGFSPEPIDTFLALADALEAFLGEQDGAS